MTSWRPGQSPPVPATEALAKEGRMPDGRYAPTPAQLAYVTALRRKWNLPERMLSDLCVQAFGVPFAAIDKRQCSDLIDRMLAWDALPDDLRVAKGERKLPGFG